MPELMPTWMEQMLSKGRVVPEYGNPDVYKVPYREGYDPNFVPYSKRKFGNIVEKQQQWNEFKGKYGEEVSGRQNYLDSLTTPVVAYSDEDKVSGDVDPKLQQVTSIKDILYSGKYKNPSLLFSSLMDEGLDKEILGQKQNAKNDKKGSYSLFTSSGIADPAYEYKKSGWNISSKKLQKEIEAGNYNPKVNLYDLIEIKNSALINRQNLVNETAKKLGIKLSDNARDYFTIIAFNAGENALEGKMKNVAEKGLLEGDKFLTDESLYIKDKKDKFGMPVYDSHAHAIRRLKAKQMIESEEFGKKHPKTVMEFKDYVRKRGGK